MPFTDDDRALLQQLAANLPCREHAERISKVEGKGAAVVWLLGFLVALGGCLVALKGW